MRIVQGLKFKTPAEVAYQEQLQESIAHNWQSICDKFFKSEDIRQSFFRQPVIVDNGHPFNRDYIVRVFQEAENFKPLLLCNVHLTEVHIPTWDIIFKHPKTNAFNKLQLGRFLDEDILTLNKLDEIVEIHFQPESPQIVSMKILGEEMAMFSIEGYLRSDKIRRHYRPDKINKDLKTQLLSTARKCYLVNAITEFFSSSQVLMTHDQYDQAAIMSQSLNGHCKVISLNVPCNVALYEKKLHPIHQVTHIKHRQLLQLKSNFKKLEIFNLSNEILTNVEHQLNSRCKDSSTLFSMKKMMFDENKIDPNKCHDSFYNYKKLVLKRNEKKTALNEIPVVLFPHDFVDAVYKWGKDGFYSQLEFCFNTIKVISELRMELGLNIQLYLKIHRATINSLIDITAHSVFPLNGNIFQHFLDSIQTLDFVHIENYSFTLDKLIEVHGDQFVGVSHHGSVALELLYKNVPFTTSNVSPIHYLCSEYNLCHNKASLKSSIQYQIQNKTKPRTKHLQELTIENIARYYVSSGLINTAKIHHWIKSEELRHPLHEELTLYSEIFKNFGTDKVAQFKGNVLARTIWKENLPKHLDFFGLSYEQGLRI